MSRCCQNDSLRCLTCRLRIALPAIRDYNRATSLDPAENINRRRRALERYQSAYPDSPIVPDERYWMDRSLFAIHLEETALEIADQTLQDMENVITFYRSRYLEGPSTDTAIRQLAFSIRAWLPFVSYAPFVILDDDRQYWNDNVPEGPLPPDLPHPMPPPALREDIAPPVSRLELQRRQDLAAQEYIERRLAEDAGERYVSWRGVGERSRVPERSPRGLALLSLNENTSSDLRKTLYRRDPILVLFWKGLASPRELVEILQFRRWEELRRLVELATSSLKPALREFRRAMRPREGQIQWQRFRPITNSAKSLILEGVPRDSLLHNLADRIIRWNIEPLWTPQSRIMVAAMVASVAVTIVSGGLGLPAAGLVAGLAIDLSATGLTTYFDYLDNQQTRQINQFGNIDAALQVATPEKNLTTEALFLAASYAVPMGVGAAFRSIARGGQLLTQIRRGVAARLSRQRALREGAAAQAARSEAADQAGVANRLRERPASGARQAQQNRPEQGPANPEVQNRGTGPRPDRAEQPASGSQGQASQARSPIHRGTPPRPPARPPRNHLIEQYGGDLPEGRPPFAPPDERVVSSGQRRFVTNQAGEPVMAEGWLYPRNGGRMPPPGSRELHEAVRGVPASGMNASHLIADRFSGPDIYQNLISFPREVNVGHWQQFENRLADLLSREPVYLQAYVVRGAGRHIPDRVIYHVYQVRGGLLELVDTEFIGLLGLLH